MRTPAWTWLLAGWLAGVFACALRPPAPPEPVAACDLASPLPAQRPPTPREWRAVPGVGRRRALDLSRALWEAGVRDPRRFDPTLVPGIGEATAARIRAALLGGPLDSS